MGYYEQFPSTNFYKQDLGWLIEKYGELNTYYKNISDNLIQYTENALNELLKNGLIKVDGIYIENTETLSFVFTKKGE